MVGSRSVSVTEGVSAATPNCLSARRQRGRIDLGNSPSGTVEQPDPVAVYRQTGDHPRIKNEMLLQNQSAGLMHEHPLCAKHPETSTLRVQLQVAYAGPLRIMRLGKGSRCAVAVKKKGLHLALARVRHKEQSLIRPLEHRLAGVNDGRALAGD